MSIVYLDTSALAKLVRREPETDALRSWLHAHADATRVSSALAEVELVGAARRTGEDAVALADRVIANLTLIAITAEVISEARRMPAPALRSSDAIHLATATIIGADLAALVAYDPRLLDAARAYRLPVAAPILGREVATPPVADVLERAARRTERAAASSVEIIRADRDRGSAR